MFTDQVLTSRDREWERILLYDLFLPPGMLHVIVVWYEVKNSAAIHVPVTAACAMHVVTRVVMLSTYIIM